MGPDHLCCNLLLISLQVDTVRTIITMPASGIKRIRGACSTCRHRKVRCDAAILDSPCTNCRRNGLFCDTANPHKDKKRKSSADTSITADIADHLTAIQGQSPRSSTEWKLAEQYYQRRRAVDVINLLQIMAFSLPQSYKIYVLRI
jgi:hypothetical protein